MSQTDRHELHRRIRHDFGYHPPSTDDVKKRHEEVRSLLGNVAITLTDWVPKGREQSLMLTKLEEAMMWANAAIARHQ